MADCSAAGTALDHVAAVTATGSTKRVVASLLGHASVGASRSGASNMPMAPPSHLSLGGTPAYHQINYDPIHESSSNSFPTMHPMPAFLPQAPISTTHTAPFMHRTMQGHAPPVNYPAMMHQQQQQQQQQFMMHQQMMMQQQTHQMHLWNTSQQQQQRLRQQTQAVQSVDSEVQHDEIQQQHDDEYESADYKSSLEGNTEVVSDWQDELLDDGWARGATMEELAAAWAQAESEYESSVNLGSAISSSAADEALALYPYEFQTPIPEHMSSSSNRDWMKEGMQYFEQGEIDSAISCFETELQLMPDSQSAKAWYMLGKCHAEHDEDRKAIACLERAVETDPYSPQALLALGVSYVNELHPQRALHNLKAWITHNPKYAGMDAILDQEDAAYGISNKDGDNNDESEFDQVQRLLCKALAYDDSDDVQEALGVVYNVSRDYPAAVGAFRKALQTRPDDYSLWNKLGATLANHNRSEEALPAYHKALQLKPKYARAWLNMAISHSNLQNYDEAARCYLQTLSLNPRAEHCWSYLRIALSCSEQWDMIPLAAARDLEAFREHYDFVVYPK